MASSDSDSDSDFEYLLLASQKLWPGTTYPRQSQKWAENGKSPHQHGSLLLLHVAQHRHLNSQLTKRNHPLLSSLPFYIFLPTSHIPPQPNAPTHSQLIVSSICQRKRNNNRNARNK